MLQQPTMDTERLVLRPFQPEDAAELERLGNEPDVLAGISRSEVPLPGTGAFWIENRQVWWEKGESADFAITLQGSGALIGMIGLGMEYPGSESMLLNAWIGKEYWNQGYCTEAALALLPFGFSNLNLHRIYARHYTSSPAPAKVLEKIGMLYEGTQREALKKNGIYESVACYAILRREYDNTE